MDIELKPKSWSEVEKVLQEQPKDFSLCLQFIKRLNLPCPDLFSLDTLRGLIWLNYSHELGISFDQRNKNMRYIFGNLTTKAERICPSTDADFFFKCVQHDFGAMIKEDND